MRLLSRLAKWFRRSFPVTFLQGLGLDGEAAPRVTEGDYLRAYELNPWVFACVRAIARSVASVPWRIEQRKRDGWQPAEDSELAELLRTVNSQDDWYRLAEGTAGSLALHGNAYWLLLRPNGRGKPKAIQLLPPDKVRVKPGEGKRSPWVQGYVVNPAGHRQEYADDEIVHFRTWAARDQYYGQSPVKPLEAIINTWIYLAIYNREFFRRGGIPSGLLRAQAQLSEEEIKRLREAMAEWHGSVWEAGRTLVLGQDLEYQPLGINPDAVAAIELPKKLREAICGAFGVPPAVVGIYEYANYANAELQRKLFWSQTVLPMLRLIEGAINEQLAPQFGSDLRFVFDVSGIEALQPDRRELAQSVADLVRLGVLAPNEARDWLRLPPLPDPAADRLYMPLSQQPITVVAEQQTEKRHKGRRLSEEAKRRISERYVKQRQLGIGDPPDREGAAVEGLWRVVARWYGQLGNAMKQRLQEHKGSLGPHRVKVPAIEVIIFDAEAAGELLAGMVMPRIEDMFAGAGKQALEDLGLDIVFNLDNPRAQTILQARRQEMRSVARRAWERVRQSLAEGMAAGETVEQLTERVDEWVKRGKEQYAQAVARTETAVALNMGALEGYRQGGATHKEWLAVLDAHTRDTHRALHGTVIPIAESFNVGGHFAQGPGDPSLPAEEVINCRCTLAPVIEE